MDAVTVKETKTDSIEAVQSQVDELKKLASNLEKGIEEQRKVVKKAIKSAARDANKASNGRLRRFVKTSKETVVRAKPRDKEEGIKMLASLAGGLAIGNRVL